MRRIAILLLMKGTPVSVLLRLAMQVYMPSCRGSKGEKVSTAEKGDAGATITPSALPFTISVPLGHRNTIMDPLTPTLTVQVRVNVEPA